MSPYTYSSCQLFLHSCSSHMNTTTWRTLVNLGIAAKLPTADIRNAFTVTSEPIDNYNSAIETVVNKHASIVKHVTTIRPKTPWHTEELSCAKRRLRRAERWLRRKNSPGRQIFTTLRDNCRLKLTATKSSLHANKRRRPQHETTVLFYKRAPWANCTSSSSSNPLPSIMTTSWIVCACSNAD